MQNETSKWILQNILPELPVAIGSILLTWINFNPSMDKQSYDQ